MDAAGPALPVETPLLRRIRESVIGDDQVMAGPFGAMQLAAMGAEVIKVEPPGGDTTRHFAGARGTESAAFNAVNRYDFTAELIKTPEGKATLQAAIDEYFPYLPSFFGGSKSKNNEIFRKWNIKQRTNDEMRADFMKRATEVANKYDLTLPDVKQAA